MSLVTRFIRISLRIVAELMDGAGRRDDATWTGTVAGPQGASAVITLFDDGLHCDGGSGDGIFGNSVFPADGYGYYVVSSTASAPGIGPFATSAFCEVAPVDDLAIGQSDIYLSDNVPEMGDSLVAYATVHNTGASAAVDVSVEFFDRRAGRIIGRTAIDVPASGAATAEVPWTPTSPDSQAIEVRVSPYVLDEVSYSNNSATREFVLGSPIGVAADGRAPKLRFAPPRPNPSVGGATFHFSLPSTAATSLEIFDILGRRVRSWQWTRLQAGDHSITWDGRGESGRRLMAGVYVCPYDQFVRLQVAGDVISPNDVSASAAVGFLVACAHNTTLPSSDKMRMSMAQDEMEQLVGVVTQSFLGLTANCGRCLEHKFDPISQKEYYQLAASLAGVTHGNRTLQVPLTQEAESRLATRQQDFERATKARAAILEPIRQ